MIEGKLKHQAFVTKVGKGEVNKKNCQWIQLNETIFHPKGGGQPSDEGTINGIKVTMVHKQLIDKNRLDQFEIYHCFDGDVPFKVGDEVELKVEEAVRSSNSKLHTAGHLIAEAVHQQFPHLVPFQGNHYPDLSYVKFKMNGIADKEQIKLQAEQQINDWLRSDLPVLNQFQEGMRQVKITSDWSSCGGTHVNSLKVIGCITIQEVSINQKEGTVTVKYAINDETL